MRSVSLALLTLLAACGTPAPAEAPPEAAPPGVPIVPTTPVAAPAADASTVTGKVAETMNAGGYTYLRITTAKGDAWAAVPETATPVGADVTVVGMTMTAFTSPTLSRTFDSIVFGTLAGDPTGGAAAAMPPAEMPAAAPSTGPVPKADGANGHTIAEVWAGKASLKDQSVAVRGRVVKATNGVMGKNWLHIQDGSGADATKDNDLTITTMDTAAIGDVITVTGPLHTDKDFGAGYSYGAIIEDAAITR